MKLRVKLVLGGLFIILFGCILAFTSHTSSKSALEKYRRELRAKGEKLSWQELIPTNSPPTPEAAKSFSLTNSIFVYISNTARMMPFVAPGRALVSHRQSEFIDSDGTNVWPSLTAELDTNRPALLQLREILQTPTLYYKLDYSQGFNLPLPYLQKLKSAELLAAYSTHAALHQQDFPEAWTNLMASVALLQRYQTEPLMISHLVKVSMANHALNTTWEALQCNQWTDEQLSALQTEWQKIDLFGPTETSFSMERAIANDTFSQARKSFATWAAISGISTSGPIESLNDWLKAAVKRTAYWAWKMSWSYDEERYNMQTVQVILECARTTKSTSAFIPALKECSQKLNDLNTQVAEVMPNFVAFGLSDGNYKSSLIKFANAENSRRLLVTAIALKRYHLRNAQYPSNLNVLVPEFLEKVPTDLMNGKPLRYQPRPNGEFLLYSVGEDGEDNNGDATPTDSGFKYKNWLKGRDAAWPQPASREEIEASKTNATPTVRK